MSLVFTCTRCGLVHRGMPALVAAAPLSYYAIPEAERAARCQLTSDDCVIDGKYLFVRGCIEVPVHGENEPFSWGVWVSLSETNYDLWKKSFHAELRSHIGPFFGWLNASLKPYPDTVSLKTHVHLRDHSVRPYIELEPTDHPLAVEQREGISKQRATELYSIMMHEDES